ncbi:MAG TPA: tandem-95 repeat protein [Accumulibacter sp.]|nr:tandem-95 repeat protein [Accumulibacter sp.]
MLRDLRAAKNLNDIYPGTITVLVSGLTIGGQRMPVDKTLSLTIQVRDFASAPERIFFGDRDLENPGYSAFALSGEVSARPQNTRLTDAQALDVWRVEQRLRYLGYPVFGVPYLNEQGEAVTPKKQRDANGREVDDRIVPHDFKIDGRFTAQEESALKLFESVVNYNAEVSSKFGAERDIKKDGILQANDGDGTTAWLNAYNAPHWMDVFTSLRTSPGFVTVIDGQGFKENYGSSWLYDWVRGYTFANPALQNTTIRFNGISSPTLYGTAKRPPYGGPHATHDVGMAFDLGFKEAGFLDYDQTRKASEPEDPRVRQAVLANAGHWSKADAKILIGSEGDLNSGTLPRVYPNNQRAAMKSFLALYDISQRDQVGANGAVSDTGSWENLPIRNGVASATDRTLDIRTALFGNGSQAGGLIKKVLIGSSARNENPLLSMNRVLERLGIPHSAVTPHHHHFHVYLRPPERMPIGGYATPKRLNSPQDLAGITKVESAPSQASLSGESLSGASDMLSTLLLPYLLAAEAPMTPTVASPRPPQVHAAARKPDMVFDWGCQVVQSPDNPLGDRRAIVVSPADAVWSFSRKGHQPGPDVSQAKIRILKGAQHGVLRALSTDEASRHVSPVVGQHFLYTPERGYRGADDARFLIDLKGKRYEVREHFYIVDQVNDADWYEKGTPATRCAERRAKRLATFASPELDDLPGLSAPPEGSLAIGSGQAPAGAEIDRTLRGIDVDIAPLDGPLAQTTGTGFGAHITLDDNAAGYGWFIDPTPSGHEEFLPTSNPNEWFAKPGSTAEGKMDLLTVLLHEYGHALGLEHTTDVHDFMAATLQPGVRRTLTAEEQTTLLRLAGVLVSTDSPNQPYGPTDPGAPLPFTRVVTTRSARRAAGFDSLVPQFDTAANAKLTNPEFADASGWATTGDVRFENGAATLAEGATVQTRLNQVFMVSDADRYLSFTVADTTLGDQADGPDDAFEVALLDANTGQSLLGGIGLTHSDALLNRQASGAEHLASGVTSVVNADGSRTYVIDLARLNGNPATATAVNLSFDLIGFGHDPAAQNSRVTLRNLRLGLPQDAEARDDRATTAEDTPRLIDVLANDLNARASGFAPVLVAPAAHGRVAVNPDGSIGYTPDADWSGTDHFTYKLSDGRVDSNLATVTLTVTPANDAPVVPERTVTLDKDGNATLDLLAGASDVDQDTLTATVTTLPSHGRLTQNADGTWTYTPTADWHGTDLVELSVTDGIATTASRLHFVVNAVNDAPTLGHQALSGPEDQVVTGNLLATAADIDSSTLTTRLVSGPAHGALSLNPDGRFSYTPAADWNGTDRFTYVVNDGELDSAQAEVVLTLTPVNDAPLVSPIVASLLEDGSLTLNFLAGASDIDGDALTATPGTPQHGSLEKNADGSYTYRPAADYNGAEGFAFAVSDGQAETQARVRLTITAVNDAPVARNDLATLAEDGRVTLALMSNDSDVEGDTLSLRILTQPAHGTLTQNADQTVTYVPFPDWSGEDSFTYVVNDGQIDSNTATARLVVTAVANAPTLVLTDTPASPGREVFRTGWELDFFNYFFDFHLAGPGSIPHRLGERLRQEHYLDAGTAEGTRRLDPDHPPRPEPRRVQRLRNLEHRRPDDGRWQQAAYGHSRRGQRRPLARTQQRRQRDAPDPGAGAQHRNHRWRHLHAEPRCRRPPGLQRGLHEARHPGRRRAHRRRRQHQPGRSARLADPQLPVRRQRRPAGHSHRFRSDPRRQEWPRHDARRHRPQRSPAGAHRPRRQRDPACRDQRRPAGHRRLRDTDDHPGRRAGRERAQRWSQTFHRHGGPHVGRSHRLGPGSAQPDPAPGLPWSLHATGGRHGDGTGRRNDRAQRGPPDGHRSAGQRPADRARRELYPYPGRADRPRLFDLDP